jgi:uncharacterized surface protein with fasciclin (FAS1) repeats
VSRRLIALVSGITAVALAAVVWGFVSCGNSGGSGGSVGSGSSDGSAPASGRSSGPGPTPAGAGSGPGAATLTGLVGSGCADYAASVPAGPGSITGMANEPVTAALSGNPLLTTFYAALSGRLNRKVDLTAQLRAGSLTVFAPVNSAFARLPAARLARLRRDAPALRALLRTHLVAGRLSPDHVVGRQVTLAGGSVTVAAPAGALRVGSASVICGGLTTADATVYLIGTVLKVA